MICQKSKNNKHTLEESNLFVLPNSQYSIRVFTDVDSLRPYWCDLEVDFPVFFHCDYLAAIHNANINGLEHRYIIIFEDEKPVGLIPLQIKDFDAKKHILDLQKEQQFSLRSQVSNFIKFYSVVNGSILVSGPYMYAFTEQVPEHLRWTLNQLVTTFYQQDILVSSDNKVNFTLVKDIPTYYDIPDITTKGNYTTFHVEPVMKLPIQNHWHKIDDYLGDMTSKYRVRYRRALKKMEGISSRILTQDEIIRYRDQIHELYLNVLSNVNFTLFELNRNYFLSLAQFLDSDYVLKGYFHEDQLIGFYTLIHNKNELHADYLGYSKEFNRSNQLYLNMLYDMVDYAIRLSFELIDFGRTALEIKSSIGAIPFQMNDLIKHKHSLTNIMLPRLLQILNKETEWVQRHPFKKN